MVTLGKRLRRWLAFAGLTALLVMTGCSREQIPVLNPQGPVAQKQYDLIMWSIALMTIVIVAVFALFTYVLIKYRAKPENEGYNPPDQHGSRLLETIWTLIPVIIVIALAIPTVKVTYDLEKPPSQHKEPVTIKVTSANWKWIFRYPEEGISTVNYVNIPADVPVKFELDAVGPMNSFWVPELGGQEYTMPDMEMAMWLEADKPGTYTGRSASYSGEHFTHMTFNVNAQSEKDYEKWVNKVKKTAPKQSEAEFRKLLEPGRVPEMTFSSYPKNADEIEVEKNREDGLDRYENRQGGHHEHQEHTGHMNHEGHQSH
ncbi:quinol oxidase subunit 2 [Marinithermofilum abyssi]|uniref:Quinol oxidase subunit 2 n=1 Tax=Marinithermofilum abyssi TaxID=1571185 RepID=A0A8J2VH71_9BACL|nr:quinol oxidase subunit 2 [Marinithermofilum abyssi]